MKLPHQTNLAFKFFVVFSSLLLIAFGILLFTYLVNYRDVDKLRELTRPIEPAADVDKQRSGTLPRTLSILYPEAIFENSVHITTAEDSVIYDLYLLNVPVNSITLPILLSDYSYVLVANHVSAQGQPLVDMPALPLASSSEELTTTRLMGTKYILPNDKIMASLAPKETELGGIRIFVNVSNSYFPQVLAVLDGFVVSDVPVKDSTVAENFPNHIPMEPNYQFSTLPYQFYLAAGYQDSSRINGVGKKMLDNAFGTVTFENSATDVMCLHFPDTKTDPCGNYFSTSGCTCCNTGCSLLDFTLFPVGKNLRIEPVLQKGVSENSGVRFVYEWGWGDSPINGSYSSIDNRRGVLEFLRTMESIQSSN